MALFFLGGGGCKMLGTTMEQILDLESDTGYYNRRLVHSGCNPCFPGSKSH